MYRRLCFLLSSLLLLTGMQIKAQWVQTNGPVEGYVKLFRTVEDSSGRRVLAGFNNEGLFISANAGNTWKAAGTSEMSIYPVCDIKTIGSAVYYVTYQSIFKSENGGTQAFSKIGNDLAANAFTCIEPFGDSLLAGSARALLVSPDRGITWKLMSVKIGEYASALAVRGNTILVSQPGRIMYSDDRGIVWNKASGIDTTAFISALMYYGSTAMAIADSTVYRSADSGRSWQKSDSGITAYPDAGRVKVNSLYISGGKIYAASSHGVFVSSDAGEHWSNLNAVDFRKAVSAVCVMGDTILASGFDMGIYRSADGGKNWNLENQGFVISDIDVLASSDSFLFAGIRYKSTFYSKDKGATWHILHKASMGDRTTSLLPIGNFIFKSWTNGSIYRTTDFGKSWRPSYKGLTSAHVRKLIYDGKNIYAGTSDGVFYTDDMGENWHEINNGLTFKDVSDMTLSGQNIFVSTRGGDGVYRTTDKGNSWTPYTAGLTDKNVGMICSVDGRLVARANNILYRFNGSVWVEMWQKIYNVSAITFKDKYLLMNSNWSGLPDYGIWVTQDYALTWQAPDTALRIDGTTGMSIHGDDLYVGTYNKGIMRCPLSQIIKPTAGLFSDDSKPDYQLRQNYPNPFNPVTTISYSIKTASHVMLRVYDMLGRETALLVNDVKPAGNHNVRFDASSLPSGMYIYTINAGRFTDSRKLLILK